MRLIIISCLLFLYAGLPNTSQAGPNIQRIVSPGGIEIWYVREKSLPIIAVDILFRNAGHSTELVSEQGLGMLVSVTLNEGAGELDSFNYLRRIEELAIDLRFNVGTDNFAIDLRTLTKNRQEAFELLGLALTKPRFEDEPVQRMRTLLINDLERRLSDPDEIAAKAWLSAAYPNHPYSQSKRGTTETLKSLLSADLHRYVKTRLTKDRLVIGAVGDVEPDEIARLVDIALGGLPETSTWFQIPDQDPLSDNQLVIERQNITQSTILIGARGISRDDPDYYAASLLNAALGGASFMSRIFKAVRQERGLAYSVDTFLIPLKHSAYFMASLGTSNDKVKEAIDVIEMEIRKVLIDGISEEELSDVKKYSIGKFVLNLDRNSRIASVLVGMQLANLGRNYIDDRVELINAVTSEDIKRVARRIFLGDSNADPNANDIKLITVIAGDPNGF